MVSTINQQLIFQMLRWVKIFARRLLSIASTLTYIKTILIYINTVNTILTLHTLYYISYYLYWVTVLMKLNSILITNLKLSCVELSVDFTTRNTCHTILTYYLMQLLYHLINIKLESNYFMPRSKAFTISFIKRFANFWFSIFLTII